MRAYAPPRHRRAKKARALAAADQAMVVNFPFGSGHRRRGIAGDGVIRPQRRPENPQRRAASCDRCLAPVEHGHRPIPRSEQCGAILSKAAAIIFVVSGHQDDTAPEKVGGFARVRERRHIPCRVDPTDIAREYQQIRRPDERRQFGAKAKRQGIAPGCCWLTFPDFDMHVAEIDDSHGGHSAQILRQIIFKMTAMRRGDFPPMCDNAAPTRPSPSVG